jgi:3-oxoacyl-(acyl-carrier-protein) synthase
LLVIESEESARGRGAPIRAVIAGDASAHHAGAPHRWPEPAAERAGDSAAAGALARAGVAPGDIGYVAAAADGSPLLDGAEERLLSAVLGEAAARVPVTSVKGAVGECGAASACAALLAAESIRDGFVPPTALLRQPRAAGLEVVGRAVRTPIARVLAHAMGSGGSEVGVLLAAP